MITFAYPWALVTLLLPLIALPFLKPLPSTKTAVRVPFLIRLSQITGQEPQAGGVILKASIWQKAVIWACWLLIVSALARPQWIEPPITRDAPMRDLMLAVDLSGSMAAEDFHNASGNAISRLDATKQVLSTFLAQRQGDRVGLIFFGSAAFLQVPFTEDLQLCETLLQEAQVRMAGPKTAFGDAIGLAIQHFELSTMEQKVLIVLTDGNDTASQIPPSRAAEIAHKNGITIYTVGVGNPESVGEEAFDEQELRAVAEVSKGQYFFAQDANQLKGVYEKIDQLEPQQINSQSFRPKSDLFYIPLVGILLLTMVFHFAHFLTLKRTPTATAQASGTIRHAVD